MQLHTRILVLTTLATAAALGLAWGPRISQLPQYSHFADQRQFAGIPNFANVISNVPFLLVGLAGIVVSVTKRGQFLRREERWPYAAFFAGILLTFFGSSYYHLTPNNHTLVWDRLPMTFAFMGLLCAFLDERVSSPLGSWALAPLLAVGVCSVFYWQKTGDLRPYVFVQFFPLLAFPVMLLFFPTRYDRSRDFWLMIVWYSVAKICELLDRPIYSLGHIVSGHTLKHLAAAISTYWVVRMLHLRRSLPDAKLAAVGR